jgi:hypothetical protein
MIPSCGILALKALRLRLSADLPLQRELPKNRPSLHKEQKKRKKIHKKVARKLPSCYGNGATRLESIEHAKFCAEKFFWKDTNTTG